MERIDDIETDSLEDIHEEHEIREEYEMEDITHRPDTRDRQMEETSFSTPTVDRFTQFNVEFRRQEVEAYSKKIGRPINKEYLLLHSKIKNGELYYYDDSTNTEFQLTYRKGKPYAYNRYKNKRGGPDFIKEVFEKVDPEVNEPLNVDHVEARDLTPPMVGLLRDYQTELRIDTAGNKDEIDKIEQKIEEWNELNPEYVVMRKELDTAMKSLDQLYDRKNDLETRQKIEELSKDEITELGRIENHITKYQKDITD